MLNKISDFLLKAGNILVIPFFCIIFIISTKEMIAKSYLSAIIVLPLILILAAAQKYRSSKIQKNSGSGIKEYITKHRLIFWIAIQIVSVLISVLFIKKIQIRHSWDWGYILDWITAYGKSGELGDLTYFARYPNNQAWLLFLMKYVDVLKLSGLKITAELVDRAAAALSLCFTQITIFLVYETSRKIFRNEVKSLAVGVAAVCALPFHMYAKFAYTDTVSMMLGIFAVYMYECIRTGKNKFLKVIEIIAFALAAVLIFKIKILVFILVIGVLIDAVLSAKNYKRTIASVLAAVILFAGFNTVLSTVISKSLPITDEMMDTYEFPPTHWVMMGLKGTGSFDQTEVDFSENAGNYQEKKDAEIEVIRQRVSDFGARGLLNHLFNVKMTRVWGTSLFCANDYSTRHHMFESSLYVRMFKPGGDLARIPGTFTWICYFILIAGILIEPILSFRKKSGEQKCIALRYAVYGVALFMLIWECNARYIFPFLPVMIILSFRGWDLLNEKITKRKKKNK